MSFIISNPLNEFVETKEFCQQPQQHQTATSFDTNGQIHITSEIEVFSMTNSIISFDISNFNYYTGLFLQNNEFHNYY